MTEHLVIEPIAIAPALPVAFSLQQSQAAPGASDSSANIPPKPAEQVSVSRSTAPESGRPVRAEPVRQVSDREQIATATFVRTPRIEFTEMPPNTLQNRIGALPLPPESVVARPARITSGPATTGKPVEQHSLADAVQPLSAQSAKRLQPFAKLSDAVEPQAAETPIAPGTPQKRNALAVPAQQVSVLPAQSTAGVRDAALALGSHQRFEHWPGRKEESGGLSIGNLEIQIIQEDAPPALPARPSSSAAADDWEMDRRYVRHLGRI
jgi:hypothetical protein